MKQKPLTKEDIDNILAQEQVNVHEQFRLQMKDSMFQEMILKIWEALFINTSPNGKENTRKFIQSFDKTMFENFVQNFEVSYKAYSMNNQFAISQGAYREAFTAALQLNREDMESYFELDKKIIVPS